MYQTYIDELSRSAITELYNIPKVGLIKHAKRFIRKNFMHQLVAPIDNINWPKGCLMVGLTANGYHAPVQQYLDKWIKKGAKVYTVDDCLAGQALLQIYQTTENAKYLKAAEKMMEFLYQHDKDEKGSLPYRPLHKTNHIYADGIGMICPFAFQYGVIKKETKAMELAMNQIRNFQKYGLDETTGLPYHIYKQETSEKLGLLGWGRAAGWIVYGIAASMKILSQAIEIYGVNSKQFKLAASYQKELENYLEYYIVKIKAYQKADELYTCSITDENAQVDSSATAMIWYGKTILEAYQGRELEDVPETFQKFIQGGQVLQAQSECIGIGQYGEHFASYPWSVGMTMKWLSCYVAY